MGGLYSVATLIVLCALSKGDLPEDDFRIISSKDLLSSDSDVFSDNVTRSFSQLLFDVARDQVIVGARDTLLRLSLRGLRPLERADWPASLDNTTLCQNKGQTEADCHNYVKVLLSYGHKLLACGTNAFSPICSWREIESVGTVTEQLSGVAHCPHSPRANMTALLASTGEYYAGTPTDFTSSDRAIYRCMVVLVGVVAVREINAMAAFRPEVEMASFVNLARDCLGWGGILGIALATFIMGCAVGAGGAAWGARRLPWRRAPRVPSSPHYITARQNSYVTVPLKDVPRKAKRQPSFTGIGGSSGILLSKSNNITSPNNQNNTTTTPKLYPKAIANEYDSMGTLRRHTNQAKNNFDFEEEKFY